MTAQAMNIVIVHPDLGIGGAERLILDAAIAFRNSGHNVKIVTNHFSVDHCFEDALNFEKDISIVGSLIPRSVFGRFCAFFAYLRLCWAALFVTFCLQADVIFMDSISLPLVIFSLFSFVQRPFKIFYCHFPDLLLTKKQSTAKKCYRFFIDGLERCSIKYADRIFVNSNFTKSVCQTEFPFLDPNSLNVLYPTLRTESLDVAGESVVEADGYDHVFLSINRFEVKKNIALAIEAMAELRGLLTSEQYHKTLLIIAGGYDPINKENEAYYSELKSLAKTLNVENNVIFMKSPSDAKKVALLRRCSMLIYTPRFEHFGIVPLEAMYLERCVLAVNAGGPTETVVPNSTGFLCNDTAAEFATYMQKVILSPELITEMGKKDKMPTVGIKKRILDSALQSKFSEKELDEIFFDYGLELDDVVVEKDDNGVENEIFKVEVAANRYDLLCSEGLGRALRVFRGVEKPPKYEIRRPKKPIVLKVENSTKDIRKYVVSAILRNVTIDADAYASFIDLQDKLHQNICRKRTLVSVGTHDLDTVTPPFVYRAQKPEDIRFIPLNKEKQYNGKELMELYLSDLHLREYVPIIQDKPLYPVIYDSKNVVCSLPPIINSEHSKITLKTKNIFIEATATDLKKAEIVLDTLVTMFSQYCKEKFTVEPVKVIYDDNRIPATEYPKLTYREISVNVPRVRTKIGLPNLTAADMAALLSKMCLEAEKKSEEEVKVVIPPTRHDILHECDVAEDVALAFGYNAIECRLPESNTVAQPFPLNKLSDHLRGEIANAGWTEVLNFALCSLDDITVKLNRPNGADNAVKISNPKTSEFQVARNTLFPGLLKSLANNRDMPLPMRLFEVQDIIVKDESADTNSRNQRNVAAVFYNKTGSFEIIHGLLDRIMEVLDVPFSRENGYSIRGRNDPTFFPDRSADIILRRNGEEQIIGIFGILHPDVLTKYSLTMPCCALEFSLEPFV